VGSPLFRFLGAASEFARTWLQENRDGRHKFLAMREAAKNQPIEKVGTQLRSMMPFLKKTQRSRRPRRGHRRRIQERLNTSGPSQFCAGLFILIYHRSSVM
jgi:hypothetical protein